MPQARTRTSTSAGPIAGASMSATANDPGAVSSSALTSPVPWWAPSYPSPSFVSFLLPDDLRRQLDVARQIVLARHLAEVGVGRVGVRVVEDDDVERRAHPSAQRHLLDDRDVPQLEERAAEALHPRREVAQVVDQADALIGALLYRVVHAVGLHRGVVEVEPADIEHRHVA